MKTVTTFIIPEDKYVSPNLCYYEDTKSGQMIFLELGIEGLVALKGIGTKIRTVEINSDIADFILLNCFNLRVSTHKTTLIKYLKSHRMLWMYLLLKSKGFYQFSINGFKIYSSAEEIRIKNGNTIFYSGSKDVVDAEFLYNIIARKK